MKVLSTNRNGKVLKTSGKGYNTKSVFNQIKKILDKKGFDYEFNFCNTESIYIMDWDNNFEIRISDHTKRDQSEETETFVKNRFTTEVNIFNTEMKNEVLDHYKNI